MRAAIYARFSSDRQHDRSIDGQNEFCRQIAKRHRCDVVALDEDRELSGTSALHRPGFQRLMERVRAGEIDAVIAEDMDRFVRNEADWHQAREWMEFMRVKLITASGEIGRLEGSVRAMTAAHFVENLIVHIRRGMAQRVREGRAPGGLTYGYDVVPGGEDDRGRRVVNEAEANIVRRIFAEFLAGVAPLAIVRALNAEGVKAPRGRDWRPSTLLGSPKRGYGILRNPLYDGRLVWNRVRMVQRPDTKKRLSRNNPQSEWQEVAVENLRIVDAETFKAVQALSAAKAKVHSSAHRRTKHLLSGLLRCGCCGGTMAVKDRRPKGARVVCSRHRDGAQCDHGTPYYLPEIERRVLAGLRAQLVDPRRIKLFITEYQAERKRLAAREADASKHRERKIAELTRAIDRGLDELLRGVASDTLRARINSMEAERKRLAAERPPESENIVALHPGAVKRYLAVVDQLAAAFERGTVPTDGATSAAIRELVATIRVSPLGAKPRAEKARTAHNAGGPGLDVSGHLAALTTAPLFPNGPIGGGLLVAGVRIHQSPPAVFQFRAA